MSPDGTDGSPAQGASSSTSEVQSAYDDLKRLIPSLASEVEFLRTSLREHSLWLLRYGHTNNIPAASTSQSAAGGQPAPGPPGTTIGQQQPPSAGPGNSPAATQETYIEPRTLPPPPGPAVPPNTTSDDEPPIYTTPNVPPYTGGGNSSSGSSNSFSTVSASTREEVSQRRDQLAEWLREGEDVLRDYSARFAQVAGELGRPQEDLLGTWRDANPDNALPDYRMVEEREELMVGGVGEVPPPYLREGGPPTAKGGGRR